MESFDWADLYDLIALMDRANPHGGWRVHRLIFQLRETYASDSRLSDFLAAYSALERKLVEQRASAKDERETCLSALRKLLS